jgi:hypothetical protein
MAPDAVLIVVGDHTPAGALGRVEPGMSGTAMAGLLHALVAEGVGAAVMWGLVPTFRAGALHVPHRLGLSMLSANADLVRAHLANALRDPAQLVTAAGTVALTVSASLLVTFSAPRAHDRPEPVPVLAPTVGRPQQQPVVALSAPAQTPAHRPSTNEDEPGDRRGPNRVESKDHGHPDDHGKNQNNADHGENPEHNDQGGDQGNNNDQGEDHGNKNDQGEDRQDNDQGSNDQGSNDQGEDQGNNNDQA